MAKDEHIQEFIKLLKQELKDREGVPKNPHVERMVSRMPPSVAIHRLSRFNHKTKSDDTWLTLAVTAYEQWEKETYPETSIP